MREKVREGSELHSRTEEVSSRLSEQMNPPVDWRRRLRESNRAEGTVENPAERISSMTVSTEMAGASPLAFSVAKLTLASTLSQPVQLLLYPGSACASRSSRRRLAMFRFPPLSARRAL